MVSKIKMVRHIVWVREITAVLVCEHDQQAPLFSLLKKLKTTLENMSETGLEEKVENMNVEEKEPKAQKGGKKAKGEKKKQEDTGSRFPLEVSLSPFMWD